MSNFLAWGTAAREWGHVFMPHNGGVEGKLGDAHFFIDTRHGGQLTMVAGEWPDLQTLLRVSMIFRLARGGKQVEVRQAFDKSVVVEYLEEGQQRLGIRAHHQLYDKSLRYLGHGMVEAWAYPNGEVFVTYAASFETLADRQAKDQHLQLPETGPPPGAGAIDRIIGARLDFATLEPRPKARHDDQQVLLQKHGDHSLELTWQSEGLRYDGTPASPDANLHQWPNYTHQTYMGVPPLGMRPLNDRVISLVWPTHQLPANPTYVALFRIAPRQTPKPCANLPIELNGGVAHGNQGGYNDQEGAYILRLTGDRLFARLPEVTEPRRITVKVIGLPGHGGLMTLLDEEPIVPQLIADNARPHGPHTLPVPDCQSPADSLVYTCLLDDVPHGLDIRTTDGIQLTYQARDPGRHLAVFDSRSTAGQARCRFSLADMHGRDLRLLPDGASAIGACQLHWANPDGSSPNRLINRPRALQILKNGPSEIAFRCCSRNAGDQVASRCRIAMTTPAPEPVWDIDTHLHILGPWPYSRAQFLSLLPFSGLDPAAWWYERVHILQPGQDPLHLELQQHHDQTQTISPLDGPAFLALGNSYRGNLLLLVTQPPQSKPWQLRFSPRQASWDFCLTFLDKTETPTQPPPGSDYRVRLQLALWGDATTTTEDLIACGQASLAAGRLTPGERLRPGANV